MSIFKNPRTVLSLTGYYLLFCLDNVLYFRTWGVVATLLASGLGAFVAGPLSGGSALSGGLWLGGIALALYVVACLWRATIYFSRNYWLWLPLDGGANDDDNKPESSKN